MLWLIGCSMHQEIPGLQHYECASNSSEHDVSILNAMLRHCGGKKETPVWLAAAARTSQHQTTHGLRYRCGDRRQHCRYFSPPTGPRRTTRPWRVHVAMERGWDKRSAGGIVRGHDMQCDRRPWRGRGGAGEGRDVAKGGCGLRWHADGAAVVVTRLVARRLDACTIATQMPLNCHRIEFQIISISNITLEYPSSLVIGVVILFGSGSHTAKTLQLEESRANVEIC